MKCGVLGGAGEGELLLDPHGPNHRSGSCLFKKVVI